jgi:hypothetical protein
MILEYLAIKCTRSSPPSYMVHDINVVKRFCPNDRTKRAAVKKDRQAGPTQSFVQTDLIGEI